MLCEIFFNISGYKNCLGIGFDPGGSTNSQKRLALAIRFWVREKADLAI